MYGPLIIVEPFMNGENPRPFLRISALRRALPALSSPQYDPMIKCRRVILRSKSGNEIGIVIQVKAHVEIDARCPAFIQSRGNEVVVGRWVVTLTECGQQISRLPGCCPGRVKEAGDLTGAGIPFKARIEDA